MRRAMNLGALIGLLALAMGLAGWPAPTSALPLFRQDVTSAVTEVGSGPVGDRGFSVTGRAVYRAGGIDLFGYLTRINGLDRDLVSNATPTTEQNTRFTYSGEIADPVQQNRGDVSTYSGKGVLRIYLQEQAALSWSDPDTFAAGQLVAEFAISLHDTVQRQAPDVGVVVGDDALIQTTAGEFSLAGQSYRFGQVGIGERFRTVGALIGDETQQETVAMNGSATVTSRKSIAVRLGGTPAAVSTPEIAACPALEPWQSRVVGGMSQVQSLGAAVAAGDLTTLDADVVSQAAADVDALTATLPAGEVPASAIDANQLVDTALETYGSGLQIMATAVAGRDAGLLAKGRSRLADGDSQIASARDAINALAETCSSS